MVSDITYKDYGQITRQESLSKPNEQVQQSKMKQNKQMFGLDQIYKSKKIK